MSRGRLLISDRILLDTHALLWWQAGGDRLSAKARRAIERAEVVLVSPISIWEIGMLLAKERIRLDRDLHAWVRDLFDDERVAPAPLSPQAAADAALLGRGFAGDPADRLLFATAADHGVPFVTRDERLHGRPGGAADVRLVW